MATLSESLDQKQLNIKSVTWGDLTWIDIVPPSRAETDYLAQHFNFHSLDLDDCLSRKQLPKLDVYEDYLFMVFHFPVYNRQTRIATHGQLSVFIGEKFLITLHNGELKHLVKLFRDCEINEEARQQNFSQGSGYLLYTIIDQSIDSYFPILDKILGLVEEVEGTVFDEYVEGAHEISILRRDIVTQRRIMLPMRTLLGNLGAKLRRFTNADMTVYYGDLMDHLNKICETLDECKEIIEVFKDTDYMLSNYRLNRITRTLAIISAVVLPFLVVSGLYGMNVVLPGGIESGSPLTFVWLLVIMFVIIGAMLYFFRRKRLI